MKSSIALLAMIIMSTTANVETCTEGVKDSVDDLFNLTLDIEENGLQVKSQSIKDVLTGVTEILQNCAAIDINLNDYDKCVDGIMPALPMIAKLVSDIKAGETSNIMMDVTQIGLQIANAVTTCIQKPKIQELTF